MTTKIISKKEMEALRKAQQIKAEECRISFLRFGYALNKANSEFIKLSKAMEVLNLNINIEH